MLPLVVLRTQICSGECIKRFDLMRFLMNASSTLEANLIRGVLDDAGIATLVEQELPLGTYGRLVGFRASVGIYLTRDEDYERAREIALQHSPRPDVCETCGYDLTGLQDPRCPECGTAFNLRSPSAPWTCANCGEQIEGQFTECWKCGSPKPAGETGEASTSA